PLLYRLSYTPLRFLAADPRRPGWTGLDPGPARPARKARSKRSTDTNRVSGALDMCGVAVTGLAELLEGKGGSPLPPCFGRFVVAEAALRAAQSDLIAPLGTLPGRSSHLRSPHSRISDTTPAPTVRPPSRMAKRICDSSATGVMSSTSTVTLSPGITIFTP